MRRALAGRPGEPGFTVLFWVVAASSFVLLAACYTAHRLAGAGGIAPREPAALPWVLMGGELPAGPLAAGLGLAFLLRTVHDSIWACGAGAVAVAAVVGGGLIAELAIWWRARAAGPGCGPG